MGMLVNETVRAFPGEKDGREGNGEVVASEDDGKGGEGNGGVDIGVGDGGGVDDGRGRNHGARAEVASTSRSRDGGRKANERSGVAKIFVLNRVAIIVGNILGAVLGGLAIQMWRFPIASAVFGWFSLSFNVVFLFPSSLE